jgi:hypothetical protein
MHLTVFVCSGTAFAASQGIGYAKAASTRSILVFRPFEKFFFLKGNEVGEAPIAKEKI